MGRRVLKRCTVFIVCRCPTEVKLDHHVGTGSCVVCEPANYVLVCEVFTSGTGLPCIAKHAVCNTAYPDTPLQKFRDPAELPGSSGLLLPRSSLLGRGLWSRMKRDLRSQNWSGTRTVEKLEQFSRIAQRGLKRTNWCMWRSVRRCCMPEFGKGYSNFASIFFRGLLTGSCIQEFVNCCREGAS